MLIARNPSGIAKQIADVLSILSVLCTRTAPKISMAVRMFARRTAAKVVSNVIMHYNTKTGG